MFLQLYHSPFFGDESNKPLLLPNEVGKVLLSWCVFLILTLEASLIDTLTSLMNCQRDEILLFPLLEPVGAKQYI